MASVIEQPNGRWMIQFVGEDRKKRSIRLGLVEDVARSWSRRVDELLGSLIRDEPVSRSCSLWLASLPDTMHGKLAAVGLVMPREATRAVHLGKFVADYIAGRVDVKPLTLVNLNQARKALVRFFGEDKPIDAITRADADLFRLNLLGRKLAENTVRRICGRARQFMKVAMRGELLTRNPFDGLKVSVGANKERLRFISLDDADKVFAACPDAQWRLIFALSRFGGLRCPSEHLALTWADVNWDTDVMTVRSPKTEHHEGKESRLLPIFPELRPYLLEAFEQAEPGTKHVITRYRGDSANLRTQFCRILKKAGLKPWPKLFHNLRSTRQTELVAIHPQHVVCAWIGNSQTVAMTHYLQVTDEHFRRAIEASTPRQKAVQNPVQKVRESAGNGEKTIRANDQKTPELQAISDHCLSLPGESMPPEGLEPST